MSQLDDAASAGCSFPGWVVGLLVSSHVPRVCGFVCEQHPRVQQELQDCRLQLVWLLWVEGGAELSL